MTDHQHPTAKPEGEGAPVDEARQAFADAVAFYEEAGHGAYYDGCPFKIAHVRAALAALSASPPVPAVAGVTGNPVSDAVILGFLHGVGRTPWPDMHDYIAVAALDYANGKPGAREHLSRPTSSADQSGVIGALVEALTAAEPLIETLHSIVTTPEVRKVVWRDLSKVRQALAAHAASIGGKS